MDHTPASGLDVLDGGPAGAAPARITLVSKPGCHLCKLARGVIAKVADDVGVTWVEVSITDLRDPDPMWWEQLPVTLVDGRRHDYWRVSESRLRAALADG